MSFQVIIVHNGYVFRYQVGVMSDVIALRQHPPHYLLVYCTALFSYSHICAYSCICSCFDEWFKCEPTTCRHICRWASFSTAWTARRRHSVCSRAPKRSIPATRTSRTMWDHNLIRDIPYKYEQNLAIYADCVAINFNNFHELPTINIELSYK